MKQAFCLIILLATILSCERQPKQTTPVPEEDNSSFMALDRHAILHYNPHCTKAKDGIVKHFYKNNFNMVYKEYNILCPQCIPDSIIQNCLEQ